MKIKSIKYQSDDRRQVVDCVHSFEHVDNLEALEMCVSYMALWYTYGTLDHKTIHKGHFFEIQIYT